MMQCRFPPTWQQEKGKPDVRSIDCGYVRSLGVKSLLHTKCRRENADLFGFAILDSSLCVADVKIFWILCVQICHNICPPKNPSIHITNKAY